MHRNQTLYNRTCTSPAIKLLGMMQSAIIVIDQFSTIDSSSASTQTKRKEKMTLYHCFYVCLHNKEFTSFSQFQSFFFLSPLFTC